MQSLHMLTVCGAKGKGPGGGGGGGGKEVVKDKGVIIQQCEGGLTDNAYTFRM